MTESVHDAATIGLARAAAYIQGESVQRTPLYMGVLRSRQDGPHLRSLETVHQEGDDEFDVYVPGPYARFQEFGPDYNPWTLHHEEGQSPYLSAAVAEGAEGAVEIIGQAIRDARIFDE